MARMETRVEKYKDYRDSFIKHGSDNFTGSSKYGTKTIPIEQVMQKAEDTSDADYFRKIRVKRVVKSSLIAVLIIALLAGLVIWGIFAFIK